MENEQIIQNSTSGSKSSNQYNTLSFGGTSNSEIPEFRNKPPNMNINENVQDNIPSTHQPLSKEQLGTTDDKKIATNQNCFEMDISVVDKKIEETRFDSHRMIVNDQSSWEINLVNSKTADTTESHGNMQSMTTDNACYNNQCMNMFDYCHQLLKKLNHIVDDLEPVLINFNAPAEDMGCLLENLQIPLSQYGKKIFHKPLETLADILQVSADILHQARPVHNADPIGEELDETTEPRITAPHEHNDDQLNVQLQTSTQSNLISSVSQETCSTSSSLSLTELLLQVRENLKQLELIKLEVNKQPQNFWKKRFISCLRGKSCPYIQNRSGKQKEYPLIKWSKLTKGNSSNLFVLVELLSYDNERHPTNIIVPPETTLKQAKVVAGKRKRSKIRFTLDDLVLDKMYGFDKESKRILCPMTEEEYCQCEKELMVKVIGSYAISENSKNQETDDEAPTDEEEEEKDISIENQLHKLFKFRICICRRTDNGELECISNFIDTELVEESKGNKSLAIDPSEVTPKYLCDCGNETITVSLNTDSEKDGFVVHLNGDKLKAAEIRGVKDKQIFFNSRPNRKAGQNYLDVKVSKDSVSKTIIQNHNPYNGLDENELLNMKIYYVQFSGNSHKHITPGSIEENK